MPWQELGAGATGASLSSQAPCPPQPGRWQQALPSVDARGSGWVHARVPGASGAGHCPCAGSGTGRGAHPARWP